MIYERSADSNINSGDLHHAESDLDDVPEDVEESSSDLRQGETWAPIVVRKVSEIHQGLTSNGYSEDLATAMVGRRRSSPDPETGKRTFINGIGYTLQQDGCCIVMDGTMDPIVFHSQDYAYAISHKEYPRKWGKK
jgi:hypothetical protein